MPRFYFTTRGGKLVIDPDGMELADTAAAKREAICFAGEWLRDDPEAFARDRHHELTVTNQSGVTMWTITMQLANGPGDPGPEQDARGGG